MNNSARSIESLFSIFQQEGVSLKDEGVNDIALPLEAALRAIAILRASRTAAIGGEIWEKVGDRFHPTYDGWSIERDDYIDENEYINATLNAAEKVAVFYSSRNGEFYITFGI